MHIQSTLVLGLLANTATAALTSCGMKGSSKALQDLSKDLQSGPLAIRDQGKNIEVKTFVHIVAASEKEEDGYLTDDTVKSEIELLNKSYNPWDFSFKLAKITRTINETWAYNYGDWPGGKDTEPEMRAALREGSYKDLNLFFVTDMVPRGKCELPVPGATDDTVLADGCIMKPKTRGVLPPTFDQVTIHEAGHWFGLEHTFHNGCEEPGDYVDDTSYEASPVQFGNCAEPGRNTCPDKPGLDPVDNYMTYVDYECGPLRFTPGQAERMHKLWELRANSNV
ncbi:hypothetical protein HYE67_002095 [Fusarium culmorum]|uniref:Peptidase M43 pregnancy-associated plasma-A domain-containing protein n=1 Tax=Fusarium culmorum TaxID=5516 RepID=A0A7S8D0S6_FUSCU|nr:hypothetical protein HYE67_002095 [Fusarium culmorum]